MLPYQLREHSYMTSFCFLGIFDLPSYLCTSPDQILYYINLRYSLTYLST